MSAQVAGSRVIAGNGEPQERHTRLRGPWLAAAHTAWSAVAIAALALFLAWLPLYAARLSTLSISAPHTNWSDALQTPGGRLALAATLQQLGIPVTFYTAYNLAFGIAWGLGFLVTGALLFRFRSDDWMAMIASVMLLSWEMTEHLALLGQAQPAWLVFMPWAQALSSASLLFAFLFPSGRFAPRWLGLPVLLFLVWSTAGNFFPRLPFTPDTNHPNLPFSILAFALVALFAFSLFYRYRSEQSPDERRKMRLVLGGHGLALLFALLFVWLVLLFPAISQPQTVPGVLFNLIGAPFNLLAFLCIPFSIGAAILRYQLWDIQVFIRRTLVYGLLTLCLAGIYILAVGAFSLLFQAGGRWLVSLFATGLVAALFQPLRLAFQRRLARWIFGERDDPVGVLTRLGSRLETAPATQDILKTMVETVAQSLKLPYAAIHLQRPGEAGLRLSSGQPSLERVSLPLVYQMETLGALEVAPRTPGEPFQPADWAILENTARLAAPVARAVLLASELQRSRQQIVSAREEERRRLRRELHDSLGPALATHVLKLETARELLSGSLKGSSGKVADLLVELVEDTQASLAEVRRIVYALRPPILDELGLAPALVALAARFEHGALRIIVDIPHPLPPLPAAVEVAAYRIAQEGLTNVLRHAQASECCLRLAAAGQMLELQITDNGHGIARDRPAGVGLDSMRERAQELGGDCVVEPRQAGGTHLCARLPFIPSQLAAAGAESG